MKVEAQQAKQNARHSQSCFERVYLLTGPMLLGTPAKKKEKNRIITKDHFSKLFVKYTLVCFYWFFDICVLGATIKGHCCPFAQQTWTF